MKYKIGDKVKIKSLKQLVHEFGLTESGYIKCDPMFCPSMRKYCGEVVTIKEVRCGADVYRMEETGTWSFSEDTIEPVGEDAVNHPNHYCRENAMESFDEMIAVFGKDAVMNFCLCNVWKYRYRAADKNGEEDLRKSDWYMKKYKELLTDGKEQSNS